jgi:two-component system, cell cycle sensor histidine kinase and response regulator CckA
MLANRILQFATQDGPAMKLTHSAESDLSFSKSPMLLDYSAFSLLFDHNPRPMWVYDVETLRFLAVNDAAVRNYLYSRRQFAMMTMDQLLASEGQMSYVDKLGSLLDDTSKPNACRIRRKDRTEIVVELTTQHILFKGRRARMVLATDVSGRERVREALLDTQEQYRDLFDHASDVIFTTDLDGKLTSLNKTGEAVTGYTMEEALHRDVTGIMGSKSTELARNMREKKIAEGGETTYQLEIARKDGRLITLAVRTSLIYSGGQPVGVRGIARDVTEHKQLEDELRQTQKMEVLGRLASGVAHDFNNLLGIILGYCELLSGSVTPDSPLQTYTEEAIKAGQRAASLTAQLLAFGRRQVLDPVVLDLNIVTANLERMLQRVLREDIELTFEPGLEIGKVKADPLQIEQVLLNLAANARDAMPNGGELRIETSMADVEAGRIGQLSQVAPGRYVVLTVKDTGVGMDDGTRSKIFEPFFTTKPRGQGTGLGLSTVYGIVKQSGGTITVNSQQGKGTSFMIYLPCIDEQQAPQKSIEAPVQVSTGTETVLLVDDSTAFLTLVRTFLQRNGYKILEARTSSEASQIAASYKGPIHLLLTDVIMPQVDGYQLSDYLRFQRPEMSVLYMSGYGAAGLSDRARSKPGARVLAKPFCKDALLLAVRQTIDREESEFALVPLNRVSDVVVAAD